MYEKLIYLPFEIQWILAAGYVSYKISSAGFYPSQKSIDVVFHILIFSFVAKSTQYGSFEIIKRSSFQSYHYEISIASAFFLTMVLALLWRLMVFPAFVFMLKGIGFEENFMPNTWLSISGNVAGKHYLRVALKDGTVFYSDFDKIPKSAPLSPCDLDAEGNIGMYITARRIHSGTPASEERPNDQESSVGDGAGIYYLTYIPKEEIARVTFSLSNNPKFYLWRRRCKNMPPP